MNKTGGGSRRAPTVARVRSTRRPLPGDDLTLFFIPPFTLMVAAREAIGCAPLLLGAQNMNWAGELGAYTGEVSGRYTCGI